MAKNFYNQDETCEKLSMTPDQLKDLVRNGTLREFRDGGKVTYKASEVDKIVAEASIEENIGDVSLSGSLSALDMLGTAELTLDDAAGSAHEGAELRLADDNDAPPAKTASPTPTSASGSDSGSDSGLGGSDSLQLAMDDALGQSGSGMGKGDSGTGELILEPIAEEGDSGIHLGTDAGEDAVSLDDTTAEESDEDAKEGTVVTSIGISVFDDDEDIEESADPLAQTVVSSGTEALGVDAAGSGSGLLDLTRESDDTSLGAELLDEIYSGDEGSEMGDATRAGLANDISEPAASTSGTSMVAQDVGVDARVSAPAAVARTRIEFAPDALSMGLTGMLFVGMLVMCLAGLTATAAVQGVWPSLLATLATQNMIVGAASLGAAVLALGVGFMLGKRQG